MSPLKLLDVVPSWVYAATIAALLAAVGVQQVRVANAHEELSAEKLQVSQHEKQVSDLKTKHAEELRALQTVHAKTQQENLDAYETKLAAGQAALATERARNDRLRVAATKYTSIAPATGQSGVDAATIQVAQQRLSALGSLLQEARGLVEEAGAIVRDRDAQIATLQRVIVDDRKVCSGAMSAHLLTDESFLATTIEAGPQGP